MSDFKKYGQGALEAAVALAVLLLALWALHYHAEVWRFPQQLEPTEGGLLLSTKAVLAGLDPWATKLAPVYSNNYGLGYPWVAALLRPWMPSQPLLQVLRSVTAASLFLVLSLCFLTWRAASLSYLEAFAASVALYIPLLYFDIPSGRPDALALALYIASLMAVLRPGRSAMLLAGTLASLAFFVKPYAVLALGLGVLHLTRQKRWRELGDFAVAGLAVFAVTALWIGHAHPNYFLGTLFIHVQASTFNLDWLLSQLADLLRFHFPLLLLALGAACLAWRKGLPWQPRGAARDWGFFSMVCLGVLLAGPGGHMGAYLRYFNELLLPLAFLFLALWIHQLGVRPWLLAAALLGNGLLCRNYQAETCYPVSAEDYAGWIRAGQWMDTHPQGYYPPLMTALAVEHHAYLVDTDHSRYLPWARAFDRPSAIADFAVDRGRWYDQQLRQGRLQTVVCGAHWPCPPDLEAMGYRQVEPICLRTPLAADRVCFSVYVPLKGRRR